MKDYPKPSVTADIIIFAINEDQIKVLLIERKHDPFQGKWALPGGFVNMNEPLKTAAFRELKEETNLSDITLEQFHSFGDPGRDPRGWTVTVSYRTLLPKIPTSVVGADDAADARWFEINKLPELAFDHKKVLGMAIEALRADLETAVRITSWFNGDIKISTLRETLAKL